MIVSMEGTAVMATIHMANQHRIHWNNHQFIIMMETKGKDNINHSMLIRQITTLTKEAEELSSILCQYGYGHEGSR